MSTIEGEQQSNMPEFVLGERRVNTPYFDPTKKFCGHCKRWLDRSAFNRNANNPTGLQTMCRQCGKTYEVARQERKRKAREEKQAQRVSSSANGNSNSTVTRLHLGEALITQSKTDQAVKSTPPTPPATSATYDTYETATTEQLPPSGDQRTGVEALDALDRLEAGLIRATERAEQAQREEAAEEARELERQHTREMVQEAASLFAINGAWQLDDNWVPAEPANLAAPTASQSSTPAVTDNDDRDVYLLEDFMDLDTYPSVWVELQGRVTIMLRRDGDITHDGCAAEILTPSGKGPGFEVPDNLVSYIVRLLLLADKRTSLRGRVYF